MNKAILIGAILGLTMILGGCGRTSSEKETPKVPTNAAVSNVNASPANTAVAAGDRDADDVKKSGQTASNLNSANSSQKRTDRDDVRSSNKASNVNGGNGRRDTDDNGKDDSDRDTDDH